MKPTRKVNAGVLAGALVLILVWAAKAFGKVEVPAEIAMALTTITTFGVQWAVPDAAAEASGDTEPLA